MNKILLDYLDKKALSRKPIWLMRQAGRYLPEYMEIRKNFRNFLDFCYTPEAASKVTIQPIERYNLDAAIIFSDILVIPHALGQKIDFIEGPVLEKISIEEVKKFKFSELKGPIEQVYESINLTKSRLNSSTTLIGFAGAPWTLACYMLGKSASEFREVKLLAYENAEILERLIEGLTESIIIHLKNQIKAGAEILQIFDSWAGLLTADLYEKYIINPTKEIVKKVKAEYPNVKIIGFPRGSSSRYQDYLATNIDVLGIDQSVELDWAIKHLSEKIFLQGNIDPLLLLVKDESILRNHLGKYLDKIKDNYFICNLGHGVIKETPVDNVSIFSEMVRNYKSCEK